MSTHARNLVVQAVAAERIRHEHVHSCTVRGDHHCTACLIEAFSQPGGCAAGYNAMKARKTRPQG